MSLLSAAYHCGQIWMGAGQLLFQRPYEHLPPVRHRSAQERNPVSLRSRFRHVGVRPQRGIRAAPQCNTRRFLGFTRIDRSEVLVGLRRIRTYPDPHAAPCHRTPPMTFSSRGRLRQFGRRPMLVPALFMYRAPFAQSATGTLDRLGDGFDKRPDARNRGIPPRSSRWFSSSGRHRPPVARSVRAPWNPDFFDESLGRILGIDR